MPATSGARSSAMIGDISARPLRHRAVPLDLAPAIRDGLTGLLNDVDTLRNQTATVRRALDDAAPRQPCLPRADFVRELARIVSFVERYSVPASVVVLHVEKLAEITERLGLEAADAIRQKVSETLAAQIRDTDILGSLGADSFGIILAKASPDEARTKADMLSELLKASPIVRNGKAVAITVTTGAQAL